MGLIASGWIDGIAGMIGVGPLRPGLMTITGTVLLIAVTFVVLTGSRKAGGKREEAQSAQP